MSLDSQWSCFRTSPKRLLPVIVMPLSYRIYDGTSQVDEDRWNEVHRAGGNPFTDLRMARAVERSMAADTRCWPVIISDGERPVAVTVFSRYRVDGALLAGGWIAKLTVWMRRIMPGQEWKEG